MFVTGQSYAASMSKAKAPTVHKVISTVTAFDMKAHSLKLADKKVFVLPAGFKDPGLKKGEKVEVTYTMVKGKRDASAVTIKS